MSITIPDRTQIRLTTDFAEPMNGHSLPCLLADTAMTNPGPIAVSTSGATTDPSTQAQCTPAYGDAGRAGYIGYNPDAKIAVGAPVSPVRNAVVDGFSGVTPGSRVFVDNTSADASGTASGLTHSQPAGTSVAAQPGTVSATATVMIVVPAGATSLQGLDVTVSTTVATDDTNYWTLAAINKGTNGSGSTSVLADTAANTNKATGGNGLTAFVPLSEAMSATPANLVVSAGQVLAITLTKTASAVNLVNLTIRATFGGSGAASAIGIGWSSTKILFH